MYKFIIVGSVIVIGIILSVFVVQHRNALNDQVNTVGNTLVDPYQNPDTQNTSGENSINNTNNTNTTKKMINEKTSAVISTNMGDITINFFGKESPKTVENFVKLAMDGFYNGIKFHRVIKGFMIQGGDPLTKDDAKMDMWGTGGPGYKFADEIDTKSTLYTKGGYAKGTVAMANSGPNTNGSQFFIMTEDYPLPPLYTIFGYVVSGQDVVDKIANVKTGPSDRPISPVIINSVTIK